MAESGQNCQKAHLQARTFHMSLFPGLYDHPLQRNSLENLMFRKTAVLDILAKFGHFRWPNLVKRHCQRHIYRPRPFIWAYSQVSTTIRCKETAWKSSSSEKPLFWTFWPNSAIFVGRIWPKLSKGTSTGQDLSYEHIPRSLRPFVTKIQPAKESMTDGQTDGRTDGRTPRIYRPPTFGVGA